MHTIEVARLAVDTHFFPLYEIEGGKLRVTKKGKGLPVSDYLSRQGRFSHLGEDEVTLIQKGVDDAWEEILRRDSSDR